ncbi:exodeoxyribonuclease III [Luteimonas viscosa]|uniref:Exodeoxyribonuclease III n=1 Tax=Luteimonas viscosa TaxID=1132694 RepID=A0A5D4XK06_9GAMM|nr:exodeoxyribonuclease III [Luteimonas viscosa]TYT24869.1 exodeoxyribonuclease III [Luteimonas viscosa]
MARDRTLKLATFNVNGIGTRLPQLLAWLAKEAPDVVALQELKAADDAFPAAALEEAGYGALWQGQRSWNGVALLGRGVLPLESRRGLPGDPTDRQSRYLEAAVHGIVVAALYLPNGNPQPGPKFDYKLRWMQRLARHASGLVDLPHPVVLMGDYNVIPTDGDVYDPWAWRKDALIQPEVREAYAQLLAQGWTDALHAHFGEAAPYTFWDYFRRHAERDRGLRIDHLLLNPALAPRLVDAGVDRWVRLQDKASDHAPTWIRITATAPAPRARKAARSTAPAKPRTASPARRAPRRAPAD